MAMEPLNTSTAAKMPTVTGQPGKVLQITPSKASNTTTTQPVTSAPAKPKASLFAPKKEDQSLLAAPSSDPKAVPGTFNGVSSMIDGYLRIARRRYVARGAYNK